jgi:hypothetical protein
MCSIAMIRKLASISTLLVCGLGLTTLACSNAPSSQLDMPADDDDRGPKRSTSSTQPDDDDDDDDDRGSSRLDRSLSLSVDSELQIEPGKTARLNVIVERGADLTGAGTITLTGLPSGVSAEPVEIGARENSVEVLVVADRNADVGRSSGLVRAKVGTVEKTASVSLVVGGSADTRSGEDWCSSLAQCCDDMSSFGEQLVCLANAGFVNDQNSCKVHLLAYIAKGDCSISVR